MRKLKKLALSTALAGVMLALGSAGALTAKTLVYCIEASPEGFDSPAYSSGNTMDSSGQTVYNRLVEFEKGTTNVLPSLASSWEISDDGLEYIFHLTPDVKFQTTDFFTPTRTLNADDVIFSFERQWKSDHPWYSYTPGIMWEYFEGMDMPNSLDRLEKIDDLTVKFVLKRPDAPFLSNLAMDFASIFSKEYADKLQADGQMQLLNQQPLGTGPFIFVNYQKDAVIRYKANPDYFKGKQPIDDLVFAITTDPAVRAQKLRAGECHIMGYPAPADIAGLKSDPNLTVMEQPGMNVAYLAYNTEEAPFDKPEVRRALNMAINKQAIIEAVFAGAGQVAKNPLPPTVWGYNETIADDVYDPETAKKMLSEAGVDNLEMKIWAMPVTRPYMPNARRTAEMMQADLEKVGVKVEIVSYEWGEYLARAKEKGRDGAVILGWTGDNGDPDNFLGMLTSCASIGSNNQARFCNPSYDELINKAKISTDQAERTELYRQAQEIFKEQAPWLVIANSTVFMPMSNKVKGYVMEPVGLHRFDGVDIEE